MLKARDSILELGLPILNLVITLEEKLNKVSKLVFTSVSDIFLKICLGGQAFREDRSNSLPLQIAWYVVVY